MISDIEAAMQAARRSTLEEIQVYIEKMRIQYLEARLDTVDFSEKNRWALAENVCDSVLSMLKAKLT